MVTFWAAALGLSLLLYVLLDGFDLGVGILFPFAPGETGRRHMMAAISPVWDGNETWLVISAATLFAIYPAAYAILLGAFYLPVIVMLCGLILRGVAFEFRNNASQRFRGVWSVSFAAGSYVAAFAQGAAAGAFLQELPVTNGVYTGSVLTWLSPFSLLCGVGLCFGYALLGAGWLVLKTKTDVRRFGYRVMPLILGGLLLFLDVAAAFAFVLDLQVTHRWLQRPEMFVFLACGAVALLCLLYAMVKEKDWMPYAMTVVMFTAAYATIVVSLLPYIVPFSLTIDDAAAPHSSLAFLFWGAGIVILPLTLAYTCVVYVIFRGKVVAAS